jgi:hypothetical protein
MNPANLIAPTIAAEARTINPDEARKVFQATK